MKISSSEELKVLSQVNQDVFNVLADFNLSRRGVVAALDDIFCIEVSEKLVRTWREKLAASYATLNENSFDEDEVVESTYFIPAITEERLEDYKPLFSDGTEMKITQGNARGSYSIVIMPDVQAPLHDVELVDKFVAFLGDFQPDELAQTGDFTDSTEIGRWVRGKKGEFAGDLQSGFDIAMDILDDIRCVFDGRFRIVRSNHDDRLDLYIEACAGGLNFRDLTFEKQMRLDEFDVEFVRDGLVELVKGEWVMGHGDEGSMSPQAGKTAFGLAKNKFGVNVVCGHTHRAGVTTESYGYNGQITRTLTGLEVGHFMDLKQAQYLGKKGGAANWQQAFGMLETIHGKTFNHLITVNDGNFSYEGVMY